MAALAPANTQKFSLDTVWSALKELKFITGFFGWLFLLMGRLAEPCMTLSAIYIVIEAGIPQASVSALHNIAVAIMISAPEVILPGSFILASQARTEGKDARLLTATCWIFVLLTLITMLSLFVLHMNQSAIALLMCARCATGVGYSILVRILSHKGLPTVHEKQGALTPEIIEQMMQKLLHNLSPTIAETVKCEVTMVLDRLTIPALQNE